MSYRSSSTASFKTCASDSEMDLQNDELNLSNDSFPNTPTMKPLSVMNSIISSRKSKPSTPSRIKQSVSSSNKRLNNDLEYSDDDDDDDDLSETSFLTGSDDIDYEDDNFTDRIYVPSGSGGDRSNELYRQIQQLRIEIDNINKKMEYENNRIYLYLYYIYYYLYYIASLVEYKAKLVEQLNTFQESYNLMENAVKKLDYYRRIEFGIFYIYLCLYS